MAIIIYDKLVRDKIPQIIEQAGKACTYETLPNEIYYKKLNEKLLEEVNEYIESGDVSEIADISEVIMALLEYHDISADKMEEIRYEKLRERGGFSKRILLKTVIE